MDRFTVPTKYWHTLEDGRIQCDVCPRACKLREGQRGVCFIRAREDDQVVLTSYGRRSTYEKYTLRYKRYRSDSDGENRRYRGDVVEECLYCVDR